MAIRKSDRCFIPETPRTFVTFLEFVLICTYSKICYYRGMHFDPAVLLRDKGIYVTAPRVAALRVVHSHPHVTADDVLHAVTDEIGAVSRQSIYDTLNTLTELGLLRRIQPPDSPARYETRINDNHHHLMCRGCTVVIDIDCAVGERPCLTASESHDFIIDEAEVVYWGYCPSCQKNLNITNPSHTFN